MNNEQPANLSEIKRIVQASRRAPNRTIRARLLNQAIGLVDANGDVDGGWVLRNEIFSPACFSGQIDLLLLHFAWCIAASDRDPERFHEGDLFWTYKWILEDAPYFPQIPLSQIKALAEDFVARIQKRSATKRSAPYARGIVALGTFDLAEAAAQYALWRDESRDYLSDCRACEQNRVVELRAWARDDQAALEAAEPILSGRMSCGEVPHITYGVLLLPALRLDKITLAQSFFKKGFRLVDGDPKLLRCVGQHLQFLALTHSIDYGIRVVSRNITNVLEASAILPKISFWLGAELLMRRFANSSTIAIDLPSTFQLANTDGTYNPTQLADHFARLVDQLSEQFDQRNDNKWLSDHATHLRGLLHKVTPDVIAPPSPRKRSKPRLPNENDPN